TPAIGFLKPFGCYVMILNTLDNLGKFKAKGDEGYFLGYSTSSKAFRVFNKRTKRVEENLHIEFLENKAIEKGSGPNWLFDIDSLTKSMNYVPVVDADACNTNAPESSGNLNPTATSTNPSADQLETLTVETPIPTVSSLVPTVCFTDSQEPSSETRLISKRVTNRAKTPSLDNILTLSNQFEDILRITTNLEESSGVEADVSNMETTITASPTLTLRIYRDHPKKPKKISDANPSWVEAMQEELLQFKIQKVWSLVDCPKGVKPIRTKWVLKNKKDERGIVIRNKARLVAQGHTQEEGIDYDEVFSHVTRIKAIRFFLAYASFMGFTDPEYPARVYKVEKAMYGLHQAPRAWYGTLLKYLLTNGFQRGLWYPKDSPFDLVAYSDSDYGGATQDRKSTTRGCQFLGRRLISWQCKKQTTVATSTTKVEYVAAASCCRQVLWIQNQLLDYGLSMPCENLPKEISTSILHLLHTGKTFDLVWIWLGGDYGDVFLNGF
nr:hypothetical protein [Tanacetum cinerariifolium]